MSSSAQPVTGIAPVTLPVPSSGVSKDPNGACSCCGASTVRLTLAVGEFDEPTPVTVMVAVAGPFGGSRALFVVRDAVRDAEPEPDAGLTDNQGTLEAAVHVTVPGPLLSSVKVCDGVTALIVPADTLAPKFTVAGVSVSDGVSTFVVAVAVLVHDSELLDTLTVLVICEPDAVAGATLVVSVKVRVRFADGATAMSLNGVAPDKPPTSVAAPVFRLIV